MLVIKIFLFCHKSKPFPVRLLHCTMTHTLVAKISVTLQISLYNTIDECKVPSSQDLKLLHTITFMCFLRNFSSIGLTFRILKLMKHSHCKSYLENFLIFRQACQKLA